MSSVSLGVTHTRTRRFLTPVLLAVVTIATIALTVSCTKAQRLTPDALFAAGNTDFDKQRFHEAILHYRLAIDGDPKRADIRLKLADTYLKFGDGTAALKQTVLAAD